MPPIHIEKLIFGGQGLARVDGKAVFVWNALPGEDVEVDYTINKKNFAEAVAVKIINPSPDRIAPQEQSFLSTSPWQILSWPAENEWKKQIALETYRRNGGLEIKENELKIESDDAQFGYRNKMEFYFDRLPDGQITLAFLNRGETTKIPADGSVLARPIINKYANYLIDFINDNNNELTYSLGQNYLEDKIMDTAIQHGIQTFFQINLPVFERALKDIAGFVEKNTPLVDYYSGTGAITLPLAKKLQSVLLVESNPAAAEYTKTNILLNKLTNCEAICSPSEKMLEAIDENKTIIVDPPRAGLDKKIIDRIISQKPPRVIYLSCDLSTQARDIKYLSELYKVSFLKLYNFFPRTPHIEGLCVLDIR